MEALELLATIESDPQLGILSPVDFSQRMPIILPKMDRFHLCRLFHRLGYEVGVEIGVCKGAYTARLARYNPQATIYGVDPWEVYDEYEEQFTQEQMDEWHKLAMKQAERYENICLIPNTSMQAVEWFEPDSIDFVYIDGNHEFRHVADDIYEWSRRVRPGGIVSGHDFTNYKRNPRTCHVRQVVGAWARAYKIKPWFVLRGRHGASWFWVKQ